ncbi:MAG: O-methyltransferase, partial [Thaumarchaeota archaeon]|nr:O-methyltransferase [Nitrososphaerota archaeon]
RILDEIDKFGQRNDVPIIGPLVGRFLHLLVRACKPRSILEIGTAIGYSTIWLASALSGSSRLTTIEIDEKILRTAKENIEKAKLATKVRLLLGDAAKLVPLMNERNDLTFLDTEKNLYPKLLPDLIRLLNVGGFLVADNTLWGGRVATNDRSKATLAIKDFDNKIINDRRLFTVIIPIRDGVSLSYKLRD